VDLYIVANVDGHIISSADGITWSSAFDAGISIGKVAIGKGVIVYTRCDVEQEMPFNTGLYYTPAYNQVPVLAEGTDGIYFNEVHYLGNRFVAVGFSGDAPRVPAFAYSVNGKNWTIGTVDPAYTEQIGLGNDLAFNDIAYNGEGYLIVGSVSGSDLAGAFYTTDLSAGLYVQNWVNNSSLPSDVNQVTYVALNGFSDGGVWSAFSNDHKTWFSNTDFEPFSPWTAFSGPEGIDLTDVLTDATGLSNLSIAEAASGFANGYAWWMLSTTNGQIIYWNHEPEGPWVNVPNPQTDAIKSVSFDGSAVYITVNNTNGAYYQEKVTISGSVGLPNLNGTHYAILVSTVDNEKVFRLDTDISGTQVDGSTWTGSYIADQATAAWSHGTYIDALGYGNGHFYAGNDHEQVFRTKTMRQGPYLPDNLLASLDNSIWTKVDDKNDSFGYWNDVDFGKLQDPVVTTCSQTCATKGKSCLYKNSCTCAKWRYFYSGCKRNQQALGICSGRSGAYVAAITVCNERLF